MANGGRALTNAANVHKELRFKVWREAFQVATYLDGLSAIVLDENWTRGVNTSGKAGAQIPHPPLGDDSSPWGR
jgi:hypothetical protein